MPRGSNRRRRSSVARCSGSRSWRATARRRRWSPRCSGCWRASDSATSLSRPARVWRSRWPWARSTGRPGARRSTRCAPTSTSTSSPTGRGAVRASPSSPYPPWPGDLAPWLWPACRGEPAPGFIAAGAAYLAAIFVTAHKEPRFIYPGLMLFSVGAAARARAVRRSATRAAALAGVAGLGFLFFDSPLEAQRPEQFLLPSRAWPRGDRLLIADRGRLGRRGLFLAGQEHPLVRATSPSDGAFQHGMPRPALQPGGHLRHLGAHELMAVGFPCWSRRSGDAAGALIKKRRGEPLGSPLRKNGRDTREGSLPLLPSGPGGVDVPPDFESGAFDHSASSPMSR